MSIIGTNVGSNIVKLEQLIDEVGFDHVIDLVIQICSDKADHIRSSYESSESLADLWEGRADALANCEFIVKGESHEI